MTADLRSWLDAQTGWPPEYVQDRIRASYDHVSEVVAHCPDLRRGSAVDVGSGPGYDTFALAANLDRVLAVDSSLRVVTMGRRLARRAGVRNVRFRRAVADQFSSRHRFDLAWCNLMSHFCRSRVALAQRLAAATAPSGWLYYTEMAEGYAPFEVDRAIEQRDAWHLAQYLREIVNGFAGRPAFRFFVSGTASEVFESAGFALRHHESSSWHSLTFNERYWFQRCEEPTAPVDVPDRDYVALDPGFVAFRTWLLGQLAREAVGPPPDASQRDTDRVWSAFAVFAEMARLVPGASRPVGSLADRLRAKSGRSKPLPATTWDHLGELNDRFHSMIGSREQ